MFRVPHFLQVAESCNFLTESWSVTLSWLFAKFGVLLVKCLIVLGNACACKEDLRTFLYTNFELCRPSKIEITRDNMFNSCSFDIISSHLSFVYFSYNACGEWMSKGKSFKYVVGVGVRIFKWNKRFLNSCDKFGTNISVFI